MERTKRIGLRLLSLLIICLGIVCLTACQGSKSLAETYWSAAKKEKNLADYIAKSRAVLDKEGLRQEADSAETLEQQFMATALLCALEYKGNTVNADPADGARAKDFFSKVLTEENFWQALEVSFYPYDCFEYMLRGAGMLDGDVLSKLMQEIPEDAKYANKLKDAIEKWIEEHPACLASVGDELIAAGFFEGQQIFDIKKLCFYDDMERGPVWTETINEGIDYISFLRSSMLPMLENQFGTDHLKAPSNVGGEEHYSTELAVVTLESLSLKVPTTEGLPETIETEGKKVIAFYRNTSSQQWVDSPAAWRILGDFMLDLPEEEYPATLEEADYYLVLTPSYEYGSFYKSEGTGKETGIQEVWSNTSIDLYEAGTGAYLRHLGTVMEQADSYIVSSYGEESLEYPELTASDILYYIYHNVNEPDAYISLVDQTEGRVEFEQEESVIVGSWEVTYHSSRVTESFSDWATTYEAEAGSKYVLAALTITNVGLQRGVFQEDLAWGPREDISVWLADAEFENFYDSIQLWTYSDDLTDTYLDPGETKDGELVFKVPDSVLQNAEGMYIVINLGYKIVGYPLGELAD